MQKTTLGYCNCDPYAKFLTRNDGEEPNILGYNTKQSASQIFTRKGFDIGVTGKAVSFYLLGETGGPLAEESLTQLVGTACHAASGTRAQASRHSPAFLLPLPFHVFPA